MLAGTLVGATSRIVCIFVLRLVIEGKSQQGWMGGPDFVMMNIAALPTNLVAAGCKPELGHPRRMAGRTGEGEGASARP